MWRLRHALPIVYGKRNILTALSVVQRIHHEYLPMCSNLFMVSSAFPRRWEIEKAFIFDSDEIAYLAIRTGLPSGKHIIYCGTIWHVSFGHHSHGDFPSYRTMEQNIVTPPTNVELAIYIIPSLPVFVPRYLSLKFNVTLRLCRIYSSWFGQRSLPKNSKWMCTPTRRVRWSLVRLPSQLYDHTLARMGFIRKVSSIPLLLVVLLLFVLTTTLRVLAVTNEVCSADDETCRSLDPGVEGCEDENERCEEWAKIKECDKNPRCECR